ncbi:MAG: phosphoribosylformylglycinamidine synthase subunit PurL [Proteobacteria bacterium]|nr:phosphoribosylformylglycinamidine synthase subunit PurL [Pseudomonadota bacterium]
MIRTENAHRALGLTDGEYDQICDILGRAPSATELAMFSVEWSEHCGYPRSRAFLARLPRKGRYAPMVGTDAGGIGIDGRTIVFKAESHNHPSQVEPHAGAATGVGGIVRDILSMGARPIALLDSLRFGALEDGRTASYVRGVVGGIQHYGNCIGVPTVGGEVTFHEAYAGNTLVNVMCVGLVEDGRRVMTSEAPPGAAVMYAGPRTGRDGIGGCSVLASRELQDDDQRPTVQIGDPFAGKCLIEATLEAIASEAVLAVKDMGAAGLTCTTAEMAAAGEVSMEVDLDKVPLREEGMEAYEIMMSESQERMLLAVVQGREDDVREIYHRWGLPCEVIGETAVGDTLTIRHKGVVVAELPVEPLTTRDAIVLERKAPERVGGGAPTDHVEGAGTHLPAMLASANICSRAAIYQQYDHQVQTNTIVGPGQGDAAVVRLPIVKPSGEVRGLALSFDCNPRWCAIDPREGSRRAVAEAALNVACVGGDPAGLTDCLNFGNPEKPERFWQFVESIEGIVEACTALEIPVVSGNVSLYNESPTGAVLPTPAIGMVGVVADVRKRVTTAFAEGAVALVLGALGGALEGSEFDALHPAGRSDALAPVDLAFHRGLIEALLEMHRAGLLVSAHDVSLGGLAVALAECCIAGGVGLEVELPMSDAALLYGEGPSRVVVSSRDPQAVETLARRHGVPVTVLGAVGGDRLLGHSVHELRAAYERGLR